MAYKKKDKDKRESKGVWVGNPINEEDDEGAVKAKKDALKQLMKKRKGV
jgi:hypothetical protein